MVCLKGVAFRLIILSLQVSDKYKTLVKENQKKTSEAARLGLSKDDKGSKTDSYTLCFCMFKVIFVYSLLSVICLVLCHVMELLW